MAFRDSPVCPVPYHLSKTWLDLKIKKKVKEDYD